MKGFTTAYEGKSSLIISKSRFLGFLVNVRSEQDITDTLKEFAKTYYDSTHICYAYIFGDNAEYSRFSDDGEPSGTAGLPILNTIKSSELNNVLVIVVRYFGGTKLGTGGLVRAYSECSLNAVLDAKKVKVRACNIFDIALSMSDYNKLGTTLYNPLIKVLETQFNDNVNLRLAADISLDVAEILTKKTNGKARLTLIKQQLIEF